MQNMQRLGCAHNIARQNASKLSEHLCAAISCAVSPAAISNMLHSGSGQECLELGCGAGVVGVALSRVGAAVVHLTDGNAAAVDNCRLNLAINRCASSPDSSMPNSQASALYPVHTRC